MIFWTKSASDLPHPMESFYQGSIWHRFLPSLNSTLHRLGVSSLVLTESCSISSTYFNPRNILSSGSCKNCIIWFIKWQNRSTLHHPNQFIYALTNTTTVNFICKENTRACFRNWRHLNIRLQYSKYNIRALEIITTSSPTPIVLWPMLDQLNTLPISGGNF